MEVFQPWLRVLSITARAPAKADSPALKSSNNIHEQKMKIRTINQNCGAKVIKDAMRFFIARKKKVNF